jgi:hypothetical protein
LNMEGQQVSKKQQPALDPCPYCKSTSFMEGERSGDEWIWSCSNPPCMFKRGIERRDQMMDVFEAARMTI